MPPPDFFNRFFFLSLICIFLILAAIASPASAEVKKGTLVISSEPKGALIYLNDEDTGLYTNTVIEDVYPGIHFVRLEMPGYRTWEKIFEVKEGQITKVGTELEAVTGGAYSITTRPEGARIFVDGEFQGISNTVLYGLLTGEHEILLTLENYSDFKKTVLIREDLPGSLTHVFESLPVKGRIIFTSAPLGADIFLNENLTGITPFTLDETEPGIYDVRIKMPGYETWEKTLSVEAGRITEITAELVPAKAEILIETVPDGASVVIDGVLKGDTPLTVSTEQGEHGIIIYRFGYENISETFRTGYQGIKLSYTLVSKAPVAISDAESVIERNLIYSPKEAQILLEKARTSYTKGDSEGAILLAERAIKKAQDVDSDGIYNSEDILPSVNNLPVYISPFMIITFFCYLLYNDFKNHTVVPKLRIEMPDIVKSSDNLAKALVGIEIEGRYRGLVCTVYIDGAVLDHIAETGTFEINISGYSYGVHRLNAHLQVIKERYGKAEVTATRQFSVEG
ncbi:PEGA domain-containing protein [Methanoplanus sp. FWC-SCC4]|uniref:PEGA domain-containing protein n=1 Tax=Methanochimaera problematica TaxID=2609417 RepID=A0AA97I544_9EURY|nr:PEGA domain-containing protein [Methanoplanus sp. FWC-SCC4]WOF17056.1 PEGA domain-containing protein [Methanoplanus sp. FWC-SCC4]